MFIANLKTFGVFKQNVYFASFRKVRPLNTVMLIGLRMQQMVCADRMPAAPKN